jgi:hypothetical protein
MVSPVGGKALEFPDSYGGFKFTTPAFTFAGMVTNTTADAHKGISLSDSVDSFLVLASGNVSHIFGDVDTYWAGMLTWRYHQSIADCSGTFLFFELISSRNPFSFQTGAIFRTPERALAFSIRTKT